MYNRFTRKSRQGATPTALRGHALPSRRGLKRCGFTLVELMVVIVIIIILMGLLLPVLLNVMAQAREAAITSEISTLDGALKAYKERYGAYPPSDFTAIGLPSVQAHLAHLFPRCNVQLEMSAIPGIGSSTSLYYPNNTGISTLPGLSPAQALVFWLSGFTSDPEHPISGHYPVSSTTFNYSTPNPPLPISGQFQFDPTRLIGVSYASGTAVSGVAVGVGAGSNNVVISGVTYPAVPVPVYGPKDGLGAPYLYFASQNYSAQTGFQGTQQDYCLPYLLDKGPINNPTNPYANPSSFQIISAGLDGSFGTTAAIVNAQAIGTSTYAYKTLCTYPSGMAVTPATYYSSTSPPFSDGGMPDQNAILGANGCSIGGYSQGDMDNLTNFSKATLKTDMTQ